LRYVGRGLGHGFAYRGILHRLEEHVRLVAGLYPAAQGFGFLASRLDSGGADPRGTIRTIGCILYSKLWVSGLSSPGSCLGLLLHVLFADLQAFLESTADQIAPNHVGLHALFSVSGRMPWAFQRFCQLIGRDVHPRTHVAYRLVDIGTEGSTPNFLPSLIFTFSSISSSITCWRSGICGC
jgi:hypothetical protein